MVGVRALDVVVDRTRNADRGGTYPARPPGRHPAWFALGWGGVKPSTGKLWAKQDQHQGDRLRLFASVAGAVDASLVLYPGSFVDVAPSFVFPDVTYVDMDRRAARFFADVDGVDEIVSANTTDDRPRSRRFLPQDYRDDLGLAERSVDLLVSLYAGFISEHCTRYLRVGGSLLVNPSHGDAAMASIDDRYQLTGVVTSSGDSYRVRHTDLDTYMIPKRDIEVTAELLHETGRAVAYTKPAFAYLFKRIG